MVLFLALYLLCGHRKDYEIRYSITYTFEATQDMQQVTICYPNLSSEEAQW